MKVVASYSTPAEAHLAFCRLQSAGIDATIRDEFTVLSDWFYSNAIGGVKVEVIEEDFTVALEILNLDPSEDGIIHCPSCGSAAISVRTMGAFNAFCAYFGIPIPATRVFFDCKQCKRTFDVSRNGKSI